MNEIFLICVCVAQIYGGCNNRQLRHRNYTTRGIQALERHCNEWGHVLITPLFIWLLMIIYLFLFVFCAFFTGTLFISNHAQYLLLLLLFACAFDLIKSNEIEITNKQNGICTRRKYNHQVNVNSTSWSSCTHSQPDQPAWCWAICQ